MDRDELRKIFERVRPAHVAKARLSHRVVRGEYLAVSRGHIEAPEYTEESQIQFTVTLGGARGAATTNQVSADGIYHASLEALRLAERSSPSETVQRPAESQANRPDPLPFVPWGSTSSAQKRSMLRTLAARLQGGAREDDSYVALRSILVEQWTIDGNGDGKDEGVGGETTQVESRIVPEMTIAAAGRRNTCRRSIPGHGRPFRGGLEVLTALGFETAPERLREEAHELRTASVCAAGRMEVIAESFLLFHGLGVLELGERARGPTRFGQPRHADWQTAIESPLEAVWCVAADGATPSRLIRPVKHGVVAKGLRYVWFNPRDKSALWRCEWGRMIRDGQYAEVVRAPAFKLNWKDALKSKEWRREHWAVHIGAVDVAAGAE